MKRILLSLSLAALAAFAQNLTPEQKESDFRYMVGQYVTLYAPLDWKKQFLKIDPLDVKPWLERVKQTKTDLEYYDLAAEYVAALQDSHSFYGLPSVFVARLGLGVDIYDGKVVIETIDRTLLPAKDYALAVGDEVVSVDGTSVEDLITRFQKYTPQGNPRASRRLAASRIVTRPQSRMPYASMVGESADVAVRHRASGELETVTIKWTKTGLPLEVGPVPNIPMSLKSNSRAAVSEDYMKPLEEIRHSGVLGNETELGLLNYGARNPVYVAALGDNFTRRLGGQASEFFYSGVFRQDELRIGYLRIPNYAPPSIPLALQQLDAELAYFQENTDGLIIDEARNTGGNLCFGENVMPADAG